MKHTLKLALLLLLVAGFTMGILGDGSTSGSCILPSKPKNGNYSVNGKSGSPGSEVNEFTGLAYRCKVGYALNQDVVSFCVSGNWQPEIKCVSVKYKECGIDAPKGTPLVTGGNTVNRTVPWHVAIYNVYENFKYICGGTIISHRIVISAAHCFTKSSDGMLWTADNFAVAAGKFYRKWTEEEKDVQKSLISDIKKTEFFGGASQNFQDDLAMLILKNILVFNSLVHPVCLDIFNEDLTGWETNPNLVGKVYGWGLTEEGDANSLSDVLITANLPIIGYKECKGNVSQSFHPYLTRDKFCAGYLNGTAACNGDSGGGLVFAKSEEGTLKHYLRGIVSIGEWEESHITCKKNTFVAFTNVWLHKDFIKNIMDQFVYSTGSLISQEGHNKIKNKSKCILPPKPKRGYYLTNAEIKTPGSDVEEFTALTYHCDPGYSTNLPLNMSYCISGNWIPKLYCKRFYGTQANTSGLQLRKCTLPPKPNGGYYLTNGQRIPPGSEVDERTMLTYHCTSGYSLNLPQNYTHCKLGTWTPKIQCKRTCKNLESHTLKMRCWYDGKDVDCSGPMYDGTIIYVYCKEYHTKAPYQTIDNLKCSVGSWDRDLPFCRPDCGISNSEPQAPDAKFERRGASPWHVGIYRLVRNKYVYRCGGTIITNKLVISAAHCFYDEHERMNDFNEYAVAAGKLYSDWDHGEIQSHSYVQTNKIIGGHKHTDERVAWPRETGMIVLVMKEMFNFSSAVHPACLNLENRQFHEDMLQIGKQGKVVGWGGIVVGNPMSATVRLKKAFLPIVNMDESCAIDLPQGFQTEKWRNDRFCVGANTNGSVMNIGDSGGGFMVAANENGYTRWHLIGLVSYGPAENIGQSLKKYTLPLYTHLRFYLKTIENLVVSFK